MTEDRIPPHDIEMEQCVIASMIHSNACIPLVARLLPPEGTFYRRENEIIYKTILAMNQDAQAVDLVTLKERLEKKRNLERVGGRAYLATIANNLPTALNAEKYALTVLEKSKLRRLIESFNKSMMRAYDSDPLLDILADHNIEERDLSEKLIARPEITVRDACVEIIQEMQDAANGTPKSNGIPTGYNEIDKRTQILFNGDITLLAAMPGDGKTSMALEIADANIINGDPVLFVTLEMSPKDLLRRAAAQRTSVPSNTIRNGATENERAVVERALEDMAVKWRIVEPEKRDINSLCHVIKYEYSRLKYEAVIIDHLIEIETSNPMVKDYIATKNNIKQLRSLAKELKTPILLLTQMNKPENRNKIPRPTLSRIRNAGEAEAAVVVFIYRENQDDPKAEIIIAKNRHDAPGIFNNAKFYGAYQRFEIFQNKKGDGDNE